MKLEWSCCCRKVRCSLRSDHAYPFNLCYCSICRKADGSGGYAINLGGPADSLAVRGEEHTTMFQELIRDQPIGKSERSPLERRFCGACGTPLLALDPRWPELIHPFASAIDTVLPVPPERTHLMLGSKAPWVEIFAGTDDPHFDEYPEESIAAWHERLGLEHPAD